MFHPRFRRLRLLLIIVGILVVAFTYYGVLPGIGIVISSICLGWVVHHPVSLSPVWELSEE